MTAQVIIIMGSKGDLPHTQAVVKTLKALEISYQLRVCSAHKATQRLLEMLQTYEQQGPLVYITIAGRSNALSAVVDANTRYPVIACPPYSDRFGGMDVLSSLRMPSGLGAVVVLEPEAAAIAAAKMLALADGSLRDKIEQYHQKSRHKIEQDDAELR